MKAQRVEYELGIGVPRQPIGDGGAIVPDEAPPEAALSFEFFDFNFVDFCQRERGIILREVTPYNRERVADAALTFVSNIMHQVNTERTQALSQDEAGPAVPALPTRTLQARYKLTDLYDNINRFAYPQREAERGELFDRYIPYVQRAEGQYLDVQIIKTIGEQLKERGNAEAQRAVGDVLIAYGMVFKETEVLGAVAVDRSRQE